MTAVEEREISLVPATDHAPALHSLNEQDFTIPTGREEEWRFTPLDRLNGLASQTPPAGQDWSLKTTAPAGVTFDAASAKDTQRTGFTDRVAASAWGHISSVAVLNVPDKTIVESTMNVNFVGTGETCYGQLDVNVGKHAQVTVILNHSGTGTLNANIDLNVADGGQLTFVSLQDWSKGSVHTSHQRITLGRDATIKHVSVTLGGDVVRVIPSVAYQAPGGSAELLGLYIASAQSHAEHRLFVDHSIDHCRSNVIYKGALNGQGAHTVWVGDVLIRAKAVGTDTYEINRNLVLGDGGRADSVPNLEIETGEIIGAGHASTTGRFDDEQLFYLMSRGITQDEAQRLVLRGFFDDLLGVIRVPEIDERVRTSIEERLISQ